jgi:hypothetical protein
LPALHQALVEILKNKKMVTSEVEPIKHEQVPRNRFHSDKFYKCEFGRQKDA